MLDTNLINVENMKATIVKVKDWVLNLYPISYIEANKDFTFFNNKSDSKTSVIKMVMSSSLNKIAVTAKSIELKVGNVVAEISNGILLTASDGYTKLSMSNGIIIDALRAFVARTSKAWTNIDWANNKFEIHGDNELEISNKHALKITNGFLCFDGKLGLGHNPASISAGNKYNIPNAIYPSDERHAPAKGDLMPIGGYKSWSTYGDNSGNPKTKASGTSWTRCCSLLLGQGTYIVTGFMQTNTAYKDGKALAIKMFHMKPDGTEYNDGVSRRIITDGANARVSVCSSTVVTVPKGSYIESELRGYQNSGSTIEVHYGMQAVRIG